jgi:hypothetical protein
MSKTSKRGSTFSSDAQHEQELCFDCASSCFAYRAFRLSIDDCLKGAISRNFLASLIAQADSFDYRDDLPASESLLRATTIGRMRKNVDSMMSRLVPDLYRGK